MIVSGGRIFEVESLISLREKIRPTGFMNLDGGTFYRVVVMCNVYLISIETYRLENYQSLELYCLLPTTGRSKLWLCVTFNLHGNLLTGEMSVSRNGLSAADYWGIYTLLCLLFGTHLSIHLLTALLRLLLRVLPLTLRPWPRPARHSPSLLRGKFALRSRRFEAP